MKYAKENKILPKSRNICYNSYYREQMQLGRMEPPLGTTFKRLREAEKAFRRRYKNTEDRTAGNDTVVSSNPTYSKEAFRKNTADKILEKLELHLRKAGLAIDQIKQKNLRDLKRAYSILNAYIQKQESYLWSNSGNEYHKEDLRIKVLFNLIERKKFLLQRYFSLMKEEKHIKIEKDFDRSD